jgi:hypothetical protein
MSGVVIELRRNLHDRARNTAARAVVSAEARALAALRLDNGAGSCGDG